jgi:hypothetical protein
MTTISKETKVVTLINVFTVEPANQQRLVGPARQGGRRRRYAILLALSPLPCIEASTARRVTTYA